MLPNVGFVPFSLNNRIELSKLSKNSPNIPYLQKSNQSEIGTRKKNSKKKTKLHKAYFSGSLTSSFTTFPDLRAGLSGSKICFLADLTWSDDRRGGPFFFDSRRFRAAFLTSWIDKATPRLRVRRSGCCVGLSGVLELNNGDWVLGFGRSNFFFALMGVQIGSEEELIVV